MNIKEILEKALDKKRFTTLQGHIKTFDSLLIDDIWKFI